MWADVTRASFTDSIINLLLHSERYLCGPSEYIHYEKAFASYHVIARNDLAEKIRGEWIFMTDTDHIFRPDTLIRLLDIKKRSGAGVVSGLYLRKFPPHVPVANLWTPEGKVAPLLQWDRTSSWMPIGPVGGGCLLIGREVLETLGKNPFDTISGLSEDYSFCLRCKENNIPIVLATQVQSHHVIETCTSAEDFPGIEGAYTGKINEKGEIITECNDEKPSP